jgi:Lrp/AsnC family transcriptional regulator for asnA, asnC and gidA
MPFKIDELDKSILLILLKDASTPYKQIAAQINRSTTTVCNRIQKLRKFGIIINTIIVIDMNRLTEKESAVFRLPLLS